MILYSQQQSRKSGFGVIGIVMIIAAALALFFVYQRRVKTEPTPTVSQSQPSSSATTGAMDVSNWNTYRNEDWGITMAYPPIFTSIEDDNSEYHGGPRLLVLFSSTSTESAFHIYAGCSDSRLMDRPDSYGSIESTSSIEINGAHTTLFHLARNKEKFFYVELKGPALATVAIGPEINCAFSVAGTDLAEDVLTTMVNAIRLKPSDPDLFLQNLYKIYSHPLPFD
jgi:hypothetical protein